MKNTTHPIIDIDPLDHDRQSNMKRTTHKTPDKANEPSNASAFNDDKTGIQSVAQGGRYYTFNDPKNGDAEWRPGSYSSPTHVNAEVIGHNTAKTQPPKSGRLGGIAQMAVGGAIAVIGVPMLVLPGPGLVAIGGGLALAAHGAKRTFSNSQQTKTAQDK